MGGGANRYLGIIVSAAKYNIVTPGAPFVSPPMPGELVMTHFHQAYQELWDTDTTIEKLGFQSANAIVEHIVERLREAEGNEPVILPPQPPPDTQAIPIQLQQQANDMIPAADQKSLIQTMI